MILVSWLNSSHLPDSKENEKIVSKSEEYKHHQEKDLQVAHQSFLPLDYQKGQPSSWGRKGKE